MVQIVLLSLFSGSFFTIKNGLIIALIVGFLSLLLLIAIVWIYLATRNSEDDIKDIIKESINERNGRIRKAIKTMVLEDDEISRHLSSHDHSDYSLSKAEIEKIVQQKVDKALEGIQVKQYKENTQVNAESTKPVEGGGKSNVGVLYASCVHENKPCFISVTTIPQDNTIYVLEVKPENENEAKFTVYEKVYRKVIEEQGHLENGCAIENPGMNTSTIVKTIEPGRACRINDEWTIKEKAKVKFE
jgi:hypothetical protein